MDSVEFKIERNSVSNYPHSWTLVILKEVMEYLSKHVFTVRLSYGFQEEAFLVLNDLSFLKCKEVK